MKDFDKTVWPVAFPVQLAALFIVSVCSARTASAVQSDEVEPAREESDPTETHPPVPETGVLEITADPTGAEVLVDGESTCFTPCRLERAPGRLTLSLRHPEKDEETHEVVVTAGEQTQVHSVLGEMKPLKLIVPTYFVGAVFTAGGISSILVHGKAGIGNSTLSEDERVFHRNLGMASLVIGVPLLTLATYWVFAGKKGNTRVSVAPIRTKMDLVPMTDARGTPAGLRLAFAW